jgi:hypothetical protein
MLQIPNDQDPEMQAILDSLCSQLALCEVDTGKAKEKDVKVSVRDTWGLRVLYHIHSDDCAEYKFPESSVSSSPSTEVV